MKKLNVKNSSEEFTAGKLVCVGRNYAEHIKELGHERPEFPLIFLKPASVIVYSGDKVIHPEYSEELHYESELVLLIGKDVKNGNASEAEDAIAGYGLGLDMTLRDLQRNLSKKGDPWTLSKVFDTSAVLSDFVLKKDHKLTMKEVISLKVNGQLKQNSALEMMIFPPVEIVKYISGVMMLEKGDLIFTGTPAGVGKVVPGDKIEAEISGIGHLKTEIA
ncbi:MAG: fumarylacetoacetate hydrolase family protein [Ignavibacteria bacterium]|jgi:5-carboxymethyl-2-hydroxymuconate isomerase|nr:fumarylacetoacetate hydrolase family protein [Ignavibacteria bacterium]MCU7503502.1 fumarylacetoacetate hydrolase family protein [Ignavibacteria bacterium]MCU7517248.1 fumarylacetoacetate hydrolase family protein [Ignavibacteria bacterium]